MRNTLSLLLVALAVSSTAAPAFGVNREIIQMQQQLDTLTQMVQNLQNNFGTQTAVLRTLIEQANDNVNSMKAAMAKLDKAEHENLATNSARFDAMTSQVQALGESLEEAKTRIANLSDQLAKTQNMIQTLNPPAPAGTVGAGGSAANPSSSDTGGGPAAPPATAAPDPDTLYKSALGDYTTGQYALAIQEFRQYLQLYPDTDLASNAQFYVGDSYYNQRKYKEAVREYDKCLEQYPNGNKQAAAQLKKGYALLALGQRTAGLRELRSLIKRYPHSHEANLARQRLRSLERGA